MKKYICFLVLMFFVSPLYGQVSGDRGSVTIPESGLTSGGTFSTDLISGGGDILMNSDDAIKMNGTSFYTDEDLDSLIASPSDDVMSFQTGGNEKVSIDNTNVTIKENLVMSGTAPIKMEGNQIYLDSALGNYIYNNPADGDSLQIVSASSTAIDLTPGNGELRLNADEDILIDFNSTSNSVDISSSTSVSQFYYADIGPVYDGTGSDSNSPNVTLKADSSGTELEATLQLIYGANPYLRFSIDDDATTPALTAFMDINDNAMTFPTDNTVDIGASGATRPKNIYAAGNIVAGGTGTFTGSVSSAGATFSYDVDIDGNSFIITANQDSWVDGQNNGQIDFYAAGGKRFEIDSDGVDVTGTLTTTGNITVTSASVNVSGSGQAFQITDRGGINSISDDGMHLFVKDVNGGDNNNFIFTQWQGRDHDRETQSENPSFYFTSRTDPNVTNDEAAVIFMNGGSLCISTRDGDKQSECENTSGGVSGDIVFNSEDIIRFQGAGELVSEMESRFCSGPCTTPTYASAGGDVYIEDDLEIGDKTYFGDTADVNSEISFGAWSYGGFKLIGNKSLTLFTGASGDDKVCLIERTTNANNAGYCKNSDTATLDDPTFVWHSGNDMSSGTGALEYGMQYHDGDNAVITSGYGGLDLSANTDVILPQIIDAAPTEPRACEAATEGAIVYVSDTNDTAYGQVCICSNLDGTGYDWRLLSDIVGTACPFF